MRAIREVYSESGERKEQYSAPNASRESLIDFALADANLLLYKQSLSSMDRIALKLDAIRQDEGRRFLSRAADYTSSRGLIESTRNPDEALEYIRATLFLQDHMDKHFQESEAN